MFLRVFDETIRFVVTAPADNTTATHGDNDLGRTAMHQQQPQQPPPPTQPAFEAALPVQAGLREERFALKEGDVRISFPRGLSLDSVEDLEAYLQVFLKKARREAGN